MRRPRKGARALMKLEFGRLATPPVYDPLEKLEAPTGDQKRRKRPRRRIVHRPLIVNAHSERALDFEEALHRELREETETSITAPALFGVHSSVRQRDHVSAVRWGVH
jgi:hypothetical protein